jgi:hypothetical protein
VKAVTRVTNVTNEIVFIFF